MLRLVPRGGPAILNVSVTSQCNAACGFCGFARGLEVPGGRRSLDASRWAEALAVMTERAQIRFVTFMGGEPLMHRHLLAMARTARDMGVQPTVVTNGWLLPRRLESLAEAGLGALFVSIDSEDPAKHEENRGLPGVIEKIRGALRELSALGVTPVASVAMTRLVGDYAALGRFLRDLGFAAATFSYPRKAPLGSSSLVYSADCSLVDMTADDILRALDGAEAMRAIIPVQNPRAGMDDLRRRLRGERERFVCHAGYKYFYLDWDYELWRCEDWSSSMGKVFDFGPEKMLRDGCQACSTDCYRDASLMLHAAVAIGDAFSGLRAGRLGEAARALADRRILGSLGAVAAQGKRVAALAGRQGAGNA
jgi:MoaA/NifB/PqqE/SkfB family radical SAM enzyme